MTRTTPLATPARRASLLSAVALLGGCAVNLPPDPVGSGRSAYGGGTAGTYGSAGTSPGAFAEASGSGPRSALQGSAYGGTPAPYAGGSGVIAPVGILPRAVAPGHPGLASGVDAPPAVAPGSTMAGPRFGDIAGAGPAIDVRERRYSNGATQDIVYRAPPTASGENKLAVSVMETSYKGGGGDALKLSAPSLADIEAELGAAFPAGAMTITDDVAQNGSGVFGYAHGRVAGETCLYAWQFIAPQTRRTLLDDVAGLEGYDVSVRMRFCAHRSVSELVAMMRGTRLNLGRLGGQQGLFSSAPTMTPAVLAGPGPVVAEPLGAALPAPPPTATAGLGAQPFAAMGGAAGGATGGAAGGLDPYGAGEAVPAGYVPVLLPGQPGPVLVLRSMLAGLSAGAAASDGPRRASRPVRRAARLAVRPSTRDAGRDPDARPAAAPATLYRGLEVRTVRSAGDRAPARMAGHMAGRDAAPGGQPFIPLPGRIAAAPAAAPVAAPAAAPPAASASLDGLPMPR